MTGHAEQLGERLRAIESAANEFDAGDEAAASRTAEALVAIFHQTGAAPSLLSQLNATYVKVASSVPKPPYPHGKFAPLTEVVVDLGGGAERATTGQAAGFPPPTFRPRLGSAKGFRSVQAPNWWRNEPVLLVGHSRVTRRDVVLTAAGDGDDAGKSRLAELLANAGWVGLRASPYGEVIHDVPARAAAHALVRQIAHEVSQSPELRKLAEQKS